MHRTTLFQQTSESFHFTFLDVLDHARGQGGALGDQAHETIWIGGIDQVNARTVGGKSLYFASHFIFPYSILSHSQISLESWGRYSKKPATRRREPAWRFKKLTEEIKMPSEEIEKLTEESRKAV